MRCRIIEIVEISRIIGIVGIIVTIGIVTIIPLVGIIITKNGVFYTIPLCGIRSFRV